MDRMDAGLHRITQYDCHRPSRETEGGRQRVVKGKTPDMNRTLRR